MMQRAAASPGLVAGRTCWPRSRPYLSLAGAGGRTAQRKREIAGGGGLPGRTTGRAAGTPNSYLASPPCVTRAAWSPLGVRYAAGGEGRGTGGRACFAYEAGTFRTTFEVPGGLRGDFQELVREALDWRPAGYLRRGPGIPEGVTTLPADGDPDRANFGKVALNVMTRPGGTD